MKRIIITVLVLFTGLSAVMAQTPEVYVTGGQNHLLMLAQLENTMATQRNERTIFFIM